MSSPPAAAGYGYDPKYPPSPESSPTVGHKGLIMMSPYDVQLAEATESYEREMSFKDAIKADTRLIWYSLGFSGTIIMEGYGMALITYLFSFPTFMKKYGAYQDGTKDYQLEYKWKVALPLVAQIGALIGIAITPSITNRLGYKRTAQLMLILLIALVFVPFFAEKIECLLVAFLLQGIPWGSFQIVSPAYASEVASLQLRPILTTWNNLCWVIGQLLAAGITKAFDTLDGDLSFRMPFAFEWIFLGILLTAITFAPESPYWYLERDRTAEACKALKKLVRKGSDERAKEKLALMQHTLQQEEKFDAADEHKLDEQPLWRRCLHDLRRPFSGVDVRRTEIACVAWIIQAMCGSSIIGWAPTLFVSAGLPPSKALSINIGLPSAGILGTLASWWLMRKMGRRTIYLWGLLVMAVLLVMCGAAAFAPGNSAGWIAGGVLIAYTAIYDLTIGPVCYSIVSEIPSIRLRAPTLAKARGSYLLVNLVNGFLTPKMVGTDAESWGWGSKTGFFYAVMCLLGFVYTWYRIPETKDLSARALDILFQHRAKTREFSNWKAAEFEAIDATAEEEGSKGTNHRRSTISVWPSATHSS